MKNVAILAATGSKRLSSKIFENIKRETQSFEMTKTMIDCKDLDFSYQENFKETFSDKENSVQLPESFRGKYVFFVQTDRNNDAIIETILTLDALRRNGAEKVYLVLPYYPYCRQDKVDGPRGAIGAKVFCDIYQNLGADGIVTIDVHSSAIQGFFNEAFVNVNGASVFKPVIERLKKENRNWLVCSPDQGGTVRASKIAEKMGVNMVTIIKKREKANVVSSMQLIGEVKDKDVLIVDDIADTCGTIAKATQYLLEQGAKSVQAAITHPVLSGKAQENLMKSGLTNIFVTDTLDIELKEQSVWNKEKYFEEIHYENGFKITVVSCAETLSQIVLNLSLNQSVHSVNS